MPSETFFQTAFLIPLPDCAADSDRGTPIVHDGSLAFKRRQ
ncbi:hypothetical protein NEILACOT_03016 [Neisseria lactamica ATCC 23970]|uniref:Uncharacterized protein n=2 Tax=Neisseria lactamica TaxID=486 RepID=E4ZBX7_NEIL0|nr:hypothetical protein NEILACOT_03016 [Neisseria lactamica ATCC 23970]CBN86854.1 hypothetical protein NLA_6170 [Neisseria lactamica 020-06]